MKLVKHTAEGLFANGKMEINFSGLGLVLITGYSCDEGSGNGSGKSSGTNKSIIWTLYGTTAGGLKADRAANRHYKGKHYGKTEFIGVDGEKYAVTRSRKPAKLSLHKEQKPTRGYVDVSAKTASGTQLLIDQALGMNFDTFIQTAYFGQGRKLSYPALKPAEQKALLEEILPLEEISEWAKFADDTLKKVRVKVHDINIQSVKAETKRTSLNKQLEDSIRASSQFEVEKRGKVTELRRREEEERRASASLRGTLEADQKALDVMDDEKLLLSRRTRVEILKASHEEPVNEHTRLRVQSNESHREWSSRHTVLLADLKKLMNSTTCPTCERQFDETTVDAIQGHIEKCDDDIQAAVINSKLAKDAFDFHHTEEGKLLDQQLNLSEEIDKLNAKLQSREILERSISAMATQLQQQAAPIEAEMARILDEVNPHTQYIQTFQNDLEQAELEWVAANTDLGTINAEVAHLEYWRDVYSKELKLVAFERCCAFLESRTDTHLKGLGNAQLHAEFSTIKRLANGETKDEFSVNVWSETGDDCFEGLSGGEQQMVSFAIGLALADLAASRAEGEPEFLILDEPFSELDARNSEAIVEYLTGDFGKTKDSIVLISNEEHLKGLVPKHIHFVKKHGISTIEGE